MSNTSKQTSSNQTSSNHIPVGVALFVMLLAFFWGCNIVAIKIGLRGVPPLASAGIRFGIALPLIVVWAAMRGIRVVPKRRELPRLLVLGLVFTVQIAFIVIGTNRTLAARASVFLNAYPVFVAFFSHWFVPNDRLTVRKIVGLIAATAGLLVVFSGGFADGKGASIAGDLLVVLSGVLLAVLVIMINRLAQQTAPVRVTIGELTVGVPLFLALSAIFESGSDWSLSVPVILALCYQGVVVAAFCFVAFAILLKRYPPSKLSVLFFTTPLWGVVASFLILGDTITVQLLAGAALVGAGIYVVNKNGSKERVQR